MTSKTGKKTISDKHNPHRKGTGLARPCTRVIQGKSRGKGGQIPKQGSTGPIRDLAAEISKLAAADAELGTLLAKMFEKYPTIKTAWEQALTQRVENIIENKFAGPQQQKDYRNITFNQLIEITSKTRRTIYDWLKKGLARNADGTFNLPVFVHWFEQYTVSKLPPQVLAAANPLTRMKAERLGIDLARQKNQLLSRNEVMAGQIARYQNLINSLSHKAEDLALLCNNQPQAKIAELLNAFFDEVLSQQCQVPEQLRLPEEKAKQFGELLKGLSPEGLNSD